MTEEYIKKSDVMKVFKNISAEYFDIQRLPIYTFPDAVKEPSLSELREQISNWQRKGHGLERLAVILYYIASKLEELERR